MIRQSSDTSYDAEHKQVELIRNSSIAKRISLMRSLSSTTLSLSRRGIKRARPDISEKEVDYFFILFHYGEKLAKNVSTYLERYNK